MGYKKTSLQHLQLAVVTTLLLPFSSHVLAGEKEQQIINAAVAAYGSNKLLELKNLQFTDNMYHFFEMQSGHSLQGPKTTHMNRQQLEVTVDFINKAKEFKRATTRLVGNFGSQNLTTSHRLFSQGKGYNLDHCLQQYQASQAITFDNADLGYGQMLDTLIIRQMAQEHTNSVWVDTAYIQDQPHDVLTVNSGTQAEYTVYINQATGHLSRMLKKRGQYLRSYDFSDHQQDQGITWAKQMFVATEVSPLYHTTSRQISFNLTPQPTLAKPAAYNQAKRPAWFDVSKLSLRQLAEGVYFVGQGWGYTLFIDVGDYFISVGAWAEVNDGKNWQQELALLRETSGSDKPVKQHIVTHHHRDHMSGLKAIVDLGASLLVHNPDITGVKAHLQGQLSDDQIIPVSDNSSLADGKVVLFDIPTSHASHNLAIYLPESKLLFTEDIFGSSYQTDLQSPNTWPTLDTYQRLGLLTDKIQQLGLEVEQYVSSHHGRVLTQSDINKALLLTCPADVALSRRLFSQTNN